VRKCQGARSRPLGYFRTALSFLERIDRYTNVYAIAQLKMDEYRQKQNNEV